MATGLKYAFLLLACLVVYTQASSQGTECVTTEDCPSLHNCEGNVCVHKGIFPLTAREIISSLIIFLLSGLANSGGIGGGSIFSSVLMVGFAYSASLSIMIVYFMVFGGSVGNFMNVAFQKHKNGRPFVEYDLSLIVMPLMLIGTGFGVIFNRLAPSLVVLVALMCLIFDTSKKILKRAKSTYEKETQEKAQPLIELDKKEKEEIELKNYDSEKSPHVYTDDGSDNEELQAILREDKELFPINKLKRIGLVLGWMVLMALIRGSEKFGSIIGLDYCGGGYWFTYILGIGGCYYLYLQNKAYLEHRIEIKNTYKVQDPNEFKITPESLPKLTWLSIYAGFLAGFLGIGGGMVLGPPLLAMGIHPQSLAATSGFFVIQTSFMTSFMALLYGDVGFGQIIFFVSLSLFGSYLTSTVLTYLINKYKRPSFVLFTLVIVFYISLTVLPIFTIWKSIDDPGQMLKFKSIC